ncbi:MAG: hypothetical protein J6S85_20005 [Methanobrevibacter sp.]|nr:hypothetical protein [Methanobrevibacter sp.]
MLNIRTDIPIKQNSIDYAQELFAQIRDLTLEAEQVLKVATQAKTLLTRDEVSKILRCDLKKIPKVIPHIRVGMNILYDQQDVYTFIDSKKQKKPR